VKVPSAAKKKSFVLPETLVNVPAGVYPRFCRHGLQSADPGVTLTTTNNVEVEAQSNQHQQVPWRGTSQPETQNKLGKDIVHS
jgi:hypothetical protein